MDRGLGARLGPRERGSWIAAAAPTAITVAALVAVSGSSAGAAPTAASAGSLPTVTCDKTGGIVVPSGDTNGYRVVLGVVSVPASHRYDVPTRGKYFRPWRFWSKEGINVRAGSPAVVVSVPKAWRTRAAITWGNAGTVSALRLASCPQPLGEWNGYPGGFVLQASSACVPLVFRVGQQSTTVRFSIGPPYQIHKKQQTFADPCASVQPAG